MPRTGAIGYALVERHAEKTDLDITELRIVFAYDREPHERCYIGQTGETGSSTAAGTWVDLSFVVMRLLRKGVGNFPRRAKPFLP